MAIGEKIRITRQNKKMSQQELADKTGVYHKSISRYELNTSIPPADALGVSTDYLVSEKENVPIKDKELFQMFEIIQNMNDNTKEVVTPFLDLVIRDFKARQAYAH